MFYTSGSQLSTASLPYLTGQVQFMHLFGNELMIKTRCLNMETIQNVQFRYFLDTFTDIFCFSDVLSHEKETHNLTCLLNEMFLLLTDIFT